MSKNWKTIKHKHSSVARVFVYTSVCCDSPADKPPVRRSAEDVKDGKFSECGLGHWTCKKCGKGCKVKRSRSDNGTDEAGN